MKKHRAHAGASKTERETVRTARVATCVKVAFHSRMDAKKVERQHTGAREKMRPYHCPTCGYWHLGHLPLAVRNGAVTSNEYYGRA